MADEILERIQEVYDIIETMPEDIKVFFARVSDEILEFAENRQVMPRQIAAALGTVIGGLAMPEAQWDPGDEETID